MSDQSRGFLEQLKIVYESTYGTTPTLSPGDSVKIPFNENQLGSDENMIDPATVTGYRWEVEPAFGNISVAGPLTIPFDVRYIGYWLKLLLGSPTTVDNLDGTFTHTFEPGNSMPSMTIETGFTDIGTYHRFTGCKANNFSTTLAVNQELTANIELIGASESTDTTSFDSSALELIFNRFNAKSIIIKEAGSTVAIVKELELEIDNDIYDDSYTLSSGGFRVSAPEQAFKVSGNMTVLYENDYFYNKAINGEETSLDITLTQDIHSLNIKINELKFPRTPPERSGMGPIHLKIPWKAYFQDGASGFPLTATLTNDVSSYV